MELTHSEQPATVELVVLALDGKGDELLVVELLGHGRGPPPGVGVDQEDTVGERVDDERLDRIRMFVPNKMEHQAEELEAQPVSGLVCQREPPCL